MESYAVPEGYYYTREDTWVTRTAEGRILVGVTDYAQKKLKKIEYLDLPAEGDRLDQMEAFGEIESMKALSELIAPVRGRVKAINTEVVDTPTLVNDAPYDKGWMVEVECGDYDAQTARLMDAAAYRSYRKI